MIMVCFFIACLRSLGRTCVFEAKLRRRRFCVDGARRTLTRGTAIRGRMRDTVVDAGLALFAEETWD